MVEATGLRTSGKEKMTEKIGKKGKETEEVDVISDVQTFLEKMIGNEEV